MALPLPGTCAHLYCFSPHCVSILLLGDLCARPAVLLHSETPSLLPLGSGLGLSIQHPSARFWNSRSVLAMEMRKGLLRVLPLDMASFHTQEMAGCWHCQVLCQLLMFQLSLPVASPWWSPWLLTSAWLYFCYQPYCASCQLLGGSGSQIWDVRPPFGCVGLGLGYGHILELSAAGGS